MTNKKDPKIRAIHKGIQLPVEDEVKIPNPMGGVVHQKKRMKTTLELK